MHCCLIFIVKSSAVHSFCFVSFNILIPCSNEASIIDDKLANLDYVCSKIVSSSHHTFSCVVVVNNSIDNTFQIASNFLPRSFKLHVISSNPGKFAALKRGLQYLHYNCLLTQDAWICFTDANAFFEKNFFNGIVSLPSKYSLIIPINIYTRQFFPRLLDFTSIPFPVNLSFRHRLESFLGLSSGANGSCYLIRASDSLFVFDLPNLRNDDFIISLIAQCHGSTFYALNSYSVELSELSLFTHCKSKFRDATGHFQALLFLLTQKRYFYSLLLPITIRLFYWLIIPLILLFSVVFSYVFLGIYSISIFVILFVAWPHKFLSLLSKLLGTLYGLIAFRSIRDSWVVRRDA